MCEMNISMENMCTGCLSTGRNLYFIGETGYYHLYSQILNEIPVYDLSAVCVRVCWECRARLASMQRFKQQVKRNYSDLMQHIPPQATSSLASHSQQLVSYPAIKLEADEIVVKNETNDHCEPEPFASALSVTQDVDLDENVKGNTPFYPLNRVKETIDHCEPEPFASALSVTQDVELDENVKPIQKKKKPKIKLKSSSKIKVKKKRKKQSTDQIQSNIEESADHLDNNHIDDNIDDIEDNIDENIEESNQVDNFVKEEEKFTKVETEKPLAKVKEPVSAKPARETSGARPQCQECGKVFSSKKTYRYHLNVLHKGQNQYPCPRCGKVYQWKSNLGRHMRSHRAVDDGELHCSLCDKSFASVATYRQHLRISRRHVLEKDFTFACDECGKRFVNKTRLRDHVDWDHLNRIKFRCQLCDKPFKCHTSLYVHTQNVHVSKERKDNLCHVCGKSYQNAAKLKYHITAMHSGETPYRCGACGAAFGWYSSLYRHMREVHYKMKGVAKKGKKLKTRVSTPAPLAAPVSQYAPL